MNTCRQCGFPVIDEACGHTNCQQAYVRGFCGQGCASFWDLQKQRLLNREQEIMDNERKTA